MREIKNNVEMAKLQHVKKEIKSEKSEVAFQGAVEDKSITDFSNAKAEVLGRSQVEKPDAIAKDVAFGTKHPSIIANADKLFDITYDKLSSEGDSRAYEKACEISTKAYPSEFANR